MRHLFHIYAKFGAVAPHKLQTYGEHCEQANKLPLCSGIYIKYKLPYKAFHFSTELALLKYIMTLPHR